MFLCGNSSVGRVQPCQGWGREFESRFPLHLKFIPRGLPRDKAMGNYQGGEAQLSPLEESWVNTPDEVKNLINMLESCWIKISYILDRVKYFIMVLFKCVYGIIFLAGWQSGHAAVCKTAYAGSIPTPAFLLH